MTADRRPVARPRRLLPLDGLNPSRYALLPGDPGRCALIAKHLDGARFAAREREFEVWTGRLLGESVAVVSTGIGCPSSAIAVEELLAAGVDTFIRVGTSGAVSSRAHDADLAIVSAAIRDEGTSSHYLPIEFPAVADPDVVAALREAASSLGHRWCLGVTQSKDSFYGEVEPDRSPVRARLHERWEAWVRGGAICSEMEAAAIFAVATVNRARAGGIMVVSAPQADGSPEPPRLEPLIETAVESVRILIRQDRTRHDRPAE